MPTHCPCIYAKWRRLSKQSFRTARSSTALVHTNNFCNDHVNKARPHAVHQVQRAETPCLRSKTLTYKATIRRHSNWKSVQQQRHCRLPEKGFWRQLRYLISKKQHLQTTLLLGYDSLKAERPICPVSRAVPRHKETQVVEIPQP
jgi:hypothetical protein